MRVLFVTAGDILRPSTRYRVLQYIPRLSREYGINCCVMTPPTKNSVLNRATYLARVVMKSAMADIVFVQRKSRVVPYVYAFNKNIIFDFDDAIQYTPSADQATTNTSFDKQRYSAVVRALSLSKLIIAGNRYLADFADKYNPQITIIPTAIDLEPYSRYASRVVHVKDQQESEMILGWIGTSANLRYLETLAPVFPILGKKVNTGLALKVISDAKFDKIGGLRVINQEWSLEDEISELSRIHIGLMPLTDDRWSRGKCGFKILQYMAVGVPVVASSVGMNSDIIVDGQNGFLAGSVHEWIDKLTILLTESSLRDRFRLAGYDTVCNHYSVDAVFPKLFSALMKTAE